MNAARYWATSAVLSLMLVSAYAGDLGALPKDAAGFQAKVGTFIRPGGRAVDARRLLEGDRFRCEEGKDADGPFLWCSRSDGSPMASVQQRYQVVLRIDGTAIASVKASTGLVGP